MGRSGVIFISQSPEETFRIGQKLGSCLPESSVVCFFGDLAAGKTTFIKGLTSSAAGIAPSEVNSPTFVILNIYKGKKTFYHFDLYRLTKAEEFFNMGFDEYLQTDGISCIEWAERLEHRLPENAIKVSIQTLERTERSIQIEGVDQLDL